MRDDGVDHLVRQSAPSDHVQAALASSHSSLIKISAGAAGFRAIAVMVSR
ncbi:hypothetical protein ACFYOF_43355 [Streptomyces sp. NPDC007148]